MRWGMLLILLLAAAPALAERRTAFMAAYQYEAVQGLNASNNLSLRTHTTNYEGGSGWMLHVDAMAGLWSLDPYFGYGLRRGQQVFFEAAAGAGYSLLDGLGAMVALQLGAELGNGWFITLPWTYKIGKSVDTYFLIGTSW